MTLEELLKDSDYVTAYASLDIEGSTTLSVDIFSETDNDKLLQSLEDAIMYNCSDFEATEDPGSYNLNELHLTEISYFENKEDFALVSGTWEGTYINEFGDEEDDVELSVDFMLAAE